MVFGVVILPVWYSPVPWQPIWQRWLVLASWNVAYVVLFVPIMVERIREREAAVAA